jgi:hypothetical protein
MGLIINEKNAKIAKDFVKGGIGAVKGAKYGADTGNVSAPKGSYADRQKAKSEAQSTYLKPDNTMLYVGGGIVVLIIVYLVYKKKI